MTSTVVLIENISDLDVIPQKLIEDQKIKKFTFDLSVHEQLKSKNISHVIADDLLDQQERLSLFDKMLEFRNWSSKIDSKNFEFNGVNLLKLLDSHELGTFLMSNLVFLTLIKKIIENENPKKIFVTNYFSKIVGCLISDSDIELETLQNYSENSLFWDKITIKYNLGKIPISFTISAETYKKIKNFLESTLGFFFGFWYDYKSPKKKSIIFLEFNIHLFSKLFEKMSNFDGDVILVNQRRPAVWNKSSLNTIRKFNCKVLKIDKKIDQNEIKSLSNHYLTQINKLFSDDDFFNTLFTINGDSFWNIIKNKMQETYSKKLPNHILNLINIKTFFEKSDVRCIVSLNEIGETEKCFLEFNKQKTTSILLEHGFIERIEKTKRFDPLSDYTIFNDKIAVWGNTKKEFLVNEYSIESQKILVTGSPRHDDYFLSKQKKIKNKTLTVLLAPNPFSDILGLSTTSLKTRYKNTLEKILLILKEHSDIQLIVKLHQIQLKHNEEIKSFIEQFDNKIPIHLSTSPIDVINQSDVVISLSPDPSPSTLVLESMILGKPIMSIFFEENIPDFSHIKNDAVLAILDSENLEKNVNKIVFDTEFQDKLILNANNYLQQFMVNPGNASSKFASILKSS